MISAVSKPPGVPSAKYRRIDFPTLTGKHTNAAGAMSAGFALIVACEPNCLPPSLFLRTGILRSTVRACLLRTQRITGISLPD